VFLNSNFDLRGGGQVERNAFARMETSRDLFLGKGDVPRLSFAFMTTV
jgi:hypothetical protein